MNKAERADKGKVRTKPVKWVHRLQKKKVLKLHFKTISNLLQKYKDRLPQNAKTFLGTDLKHCLSKLVAAGDSEGLSKEQKAYVQHHCKANNKQRLAEEQMRDSGKRFCDPTPPTRRQQVAAAKAAAKEKACRAVKVDARKKSFELSKSTKLWISKGCSSAVKDACTKADWATKCARVSTIWNSDLAATPSLSNLTEPKVQNDSKGTRHQVLSFPMLASRVLGKKVREPSYFSGGLKQRVATPNSIKCVPAFKQDKLAFSPTKQFATQYPDTINLLRRASTVAGSKWKLFKENEARCDDDLKRKKFNLFRVNQLHDLTGLIMKMSLRDPLRSGGKFTSVHPKPAVKAPNAKQARVHPKPAVKAPNAKRARV